MFGNCGVTARCRSPRARISFGQCARRIHEDVRAERCVQVEVGVGGKTPRDRRAVGETGLAHDGLLQVSVVTPVRVEVAGRAVGERRFGRVPAGGASVGGAPENAHPARGARSDPEGNARRGQHGAALVEGVPVVVAPLADRHAVGQFGHEVAPARNHVAPHQHVVSGQFRQGAQRRHPGQEVVDTGVRELPRLIEADVHPAAGEQGEQLGQQLAHELERARVRGLESHRGTTDPVRVGEAVRFDRQLPVLLVGQPPVHVAQAVLVRHQLDVARSCSRRRAP